QAPIFLNPEVRKAMDIALDRERIIKDVFNGYASPLHAPLPGNIGTSTPSTSKEKALDLLLENGWARNPETSILEKKTKDTTETLSFSIATANAPELVRVAEIMEKEWEQIGISVDVEIFEPVDLNQNVIRPRQY